MIHARLLTSSDQQRSLTRAIYDCLANGKVGAFESPTGTGKSMSVAIGSLSYLRDYNKIVAQLDTDSEEEHIDKDEPEFVRVHARKVRAATKMAKRQALLEPTQLNLKRKRDETFRSDDEPDPVEGVSVKLDDGLSREVRTLLNQLDGPRKPDIIPDARPPYAGLKIIYASRTHSQLSQFLGELRKTSFNTIRTIALGSRKNLCINDKVRKGGDEGLNDRCKDLQLSATPCQYMPRDLEERKELFDKFSGHTATIPLDIESLADAGKALQTCPYYGSRSALDQAQLITIPYSLLLSSSSRSSLGLILDEKTIIIIDEAHNLVESVLSVASASITNAEFEIAAGQIKTYLDKFRQRFSGDNLVMLKIFGKVLGAFLKFSRSICDAKASNAARVNTLGHFVEVLGISQINMGSLANWMRKYRLAQKVSGYVTENQAATKANESKSRLIDSMHRIENFISCLATASADGRIFVNVAASPQHKITQQENPVPHVEKLVTLQYKLLNAAPAFQDIVDETRSLVLAGGTMTPLSDFRDLLFPQLNVDRWAEFSCGHVVPAESVLGCVMSHGPKGYELTFTYENRGNSKMLDELGAVMINLCNIVPHGVVAFLPSYAFLDSVLAQWTRTGLIARFKKQLFVEPRAGSEVEGVLKDYADANCGDGRGGIMFAVMGAKLSEGINFSDHLCRAVVIVGLPFGSLADIEMKERMTYLGKEKGDRFYFGTCMRSVNQAIGRAVRHQKDWAAVVMIDTRYGQKRVLDALPEWIRRRIEGNNEGSMSTQLFGANIRRLAQFYKTMKC